MYDAFQESIHPKAAIFIYKSLLSLSKYDRQGPEQLNTNNKLVFVSPRFQLLVKKVHLVVSL